MVVVSEERGVISLVDGGELLEDLDAKGLQVALGAALNGVTPEPRRPTRRPAVAAETSDA